MRKSLMFSVTCWLVRAGLGIGVAMGAAVPASADMVTDWNAITAKTVSSVTPPPKPQYLAAIVHAAIYDAVNAIDRGHQVYNVDITAPAGASIEAAAAAAAHGALVKLVPDQQMALDAALASSLKALPDGQAKTDGIAVGREAAAKTVAARNADGRDAKVPYEPGSAPGSWQPTPPYMSPASGVQFGAVKPFFLKSTDQFALPGPLAITSAEYAKEINEVRELGSADSTKRTAAQTAIAIFWTDNPTHIWGEVAQAASKEHKLSVADNARLFALMQMAMADASLAAWSAKYKYNLMRPITAIRDAAAQGNPGIAADQSWEPLIGTPPHPDYPSGHTVDAGAAVTVLQSFFDSDKVTVDVIYPGRYGTIRHWHSFSEIVREVENARVWGGIHTRTADTHGTAVGRQIAEYAFANFMKPVK
jgi:hypothetical protein